MRVIGTAGHVDHGKSALVEALTGVHPDRLKEEREREMTIDLGFAWLKLPEWASLPDSEEIGIVDVPGHRDFIENMLAGVGGIDAALFVIAADQGVMPQTEEHLAILNILNIQSGVVVLTKIDLVNEDDWLDLVEEETRQLLAGTVLDGAPIVRVSVKTGTGLDELTLAISNVLARQPPRPDLRRPRLPIDRVFTIAGFGTVVTGTLSDGRLTLGEDIEILPAGSRGRIRGLQTHRRKEEVAEPGGRTAVNISGLESRQITRGDVLAHPGDYSPTRRLDAGFTLLPDLDASIKHDMEVKFFIGASEVLARVRLIGTEIIHPGASGWLQLELKNPVVAVRGDRYILRRPSPGATLGGGEILDPHPAGRHRRFSPKVIKRMEALSRGTPEEILMESAQGSGLTTLRNLRITSGLDVSAFELALAESFRNGDLIALDAIEKQLEDTIVVTRTNWLGISRIALTQVQQYHERFPLRRGMAKEELRSRMGLSSRQFNVVNLKLVRDGVLVDAGPLLCLPGFKVTFTPDQARSVQELMGRFEADPTSPPSIRDARTIVGEDILNVLIESQTLMPVSADVVFRKEDFDRMVAELKDSLKSEGTISVAEFRDRFSTSRKYALAFLEYLDSVGVTVREGDVRRLKTV